MKLLSFVIFNLVTFSLFVFAQPTLSADQYAAFAPLGEIARKAIPQDKPGRLRAYFLPKDQAPEKAIHDLKEALALEKGRTGYFALLSEDSTVLKKMAVEALAEVKPNCFSKLTIIFVGKTKDAESVKNALVHTGAHFIFKEH